MSVKENSREKSVFSRNYSQVIPKSFLTAQRSRPAVCESAQSGEAGPPEKAAVLRIRRPSHNEVLFLSALYKKPRAQRVRPNQRRVVFVCVALNPCPPWYRRQTDITEDDEKTWNSSAL